MLRLYTFNLSHFSEKARWALDYEGIAYEEKVLLPGPHQLTTRRVAKRSEVPILQHDRRYVQGSSAILDYIADHLGGSKLTPRSPEARAASLELEREADRAFGRGVQRVLYSVMLEPEHAHHVIDLWTENGPRWGRTFYRFTFPLISRAVQSMYQTTKPELVTESQDHFVSMMDKLDAQLARAPYLGGEQPSRLDISVAALLGPLCAPAEHHVRWPATPPELRGFEARLEGRPTWNHVLEMYREHRRPARAAS
jgi:glutathione S-transferase